MADRVLIALQSETQSVVLNALSRASKLPNLSSDTIQQAMRLLCHPDAAIRAQAVSLTGIYQKVSLAGQQLSWMFTSGENDQLVLLPLCSAIRHLTIKRVINKKTISPSYARIIVDEKRDPNLRLTAYANLLLIHNRPGAVGWQARANLGASQFNPENLKWDQGWIKQFLLKDEIKHYLRTSDYFEAHPAYMGELETPNTSVVLDMLSKLALLNVPPSPKIGQQVATLLRHSDKEIRASAVVVAGIRWKLRDVLLRIKAMLSGEERDRDVLYPLCSAAAALITAGFAAPREFSTLFAKIILDESRDPPLRRAANFDLRRIFSDPGGQSFAYDSAIGNINEIPFDLDWVRKTIT